MGAVSVSAVKVLSEVMSNQPTTETSLSHIEPVLNPDRTVRILGVPMAFGASMAGVDMGPAALRVARLHERLRNLATVQDSGDLRVERPNSRSQTDDTLNTSLN